MIKAGVIAIPSALLIAAFVAMLAAASSRAERARESVENAAAVEPPSRTIPLEEGRVLTCWTFPLRSYDGQTQKCVACEEQTSDARPQRPMMLACK